ncbi:hypothetical protein AB837_00531 [bacterium AB1]|nr:hypothetical protein AB837_00531 [bacterium AB1]
MVQISEEQCDTVTLDLKKTECNESSEKKEQQQEGITTTLLEDSQQLEDSEEKNDIFLVEAESSEFLKKIKENQKKILENLEFEFQKQQQAQKEIDRAKNIINLLHYGCVSFLFFMLAKVCYDNFSDFLLEFTD